MVDREKKHTFVQKTIVNIQKDMKKHLQIIALCLLVAGAPIHAMAQSESEDIETELSAISLSVNGSKVHIAGAEGQTLEVYNLTGTKVTAIRIDSNDKAFMLPLQRGCYILKVGKIVRKISIR